MGSDRHWNATRFSPTIAFGNSLLHSTGDLLHCGITPEMEKDRAETKIGAERYEAIKRPKKRFIGRRAAVEKAEDKIDISDSNSEVADDRVVQGIHILDSPTQDRLIQI